MGAVSRRWMWVESMGVVVRRCIDYLILLIPTPLVSVLFCSSIPTFCLFLTLGAHARSEGYCSCPVCVYVCVCVCVRSNQGCQSGKLLAPKK